MAPKTGALPTIRRPPPPSPGLESWIQGGSAAPAEPPPELVDLAAIVLNAGTQVRVKGLVEERVVRYVEMLDAGQEPPPFKLRRDPSGRLLMGDGAHRFESLRRRERPQHRAIVLPGTWLDAYRDGLRGNGKHGLDLSDADRAAALTTLLQSEEYKAGKLTQVQIAQDLGYSEGRVSQRAKELREAGATVKPLTVEGADGRTQRRENLGARSDLTVKRLTVKGGRASRAADPAPAPPPKEPLPPPRPTRPLRPQPRPRPPIVAIEEDLEAGLHLAQDLRRQDRTDDYALLLRLLRGAAAGAGFQLAQVSSADSDALREGRTAEIAGAQVLVVAVVPAIGGDTRFVLTRSPDDVDGQEAAGVA